MILELVTSLRIAIASICICVIGYGAAVLLTAIVIAPAARQGRLVVIHDQIVGGDLVAQGFTRPEYIWPRPSAVDFAANATGGSNLSPANPAIRERAEEIIARLGATADNPAPAELVLASGSGLDPHITEAAAFYQAERVARARGVSVQSVRGAIVELAEPIGVGETSRVINVLRLNIELDRLFPVSEIGDNDDSESSDI